MFIDILVYSIDNGKVNFKLKDLKLSRYNLLWAKQVICNTL